MYMTPLLEKEKVLSPFTTLHVGGRAQFFIRVKEISELSYAVRFAKERALPIFFLGGGSNLLIGDHGVSGLVIKVEHKGFSFETKKNYTLVRVGAGENWDSVVEESVKRELFGIENLSLIPGTVGATPVQNIGAYGQEVSNVIDHVLTFDTEEEGWRVFTREECAFNYRDSFFKSKLGKRFLVWEVVYKLCHEGSCNISYRDLEEYFRDQGIFPSLNTVRAAVIKIRKQKFPSVDEGYTAGSFFKNPIITQEEFASLKARFKDLPGFALSHGEVKVPLAWIIEHVLKMKGFREGTVGTFIRQPLVLVNFGGASAGDVDQFAKKIFSEVERLTGIKIEREVEFVGK